MSRDIIPPTKIASLFEDDWITEVLFAVKSGKEATVYCCRAHPIRGAAFYALKLYKPRAYRDFRNDAIYQEGRFPRETREVRAIRKKSAKGRAFQFGSWLGHEFETLSRLSEAGCYVPRPLVVNASAILMEFIAADEGSDQPAQPLSSVRLPPAEAGALFEDALRNLEIMLRCNLVHGDLSAYNILYAGGRLCFIDFPQATDARFNPNAETLFARDAGNICKYFARQGIATDPDKIVEQLWGRYMRAEL